jgi:ComF family protein
VTLADYRAQSAVREWLLAFKHGGRRDLAVPLGRALGHVVGRHLSEPTILVPVPLHPWRRIERGYDQALELACEAAAVGPFEVCPVLKRTRATPPQGSLGAASRTANVRGAFRSRRLSRLIGTALPFQGRRVWLIDDVVTSGATVAACAKELRRLGASSVAVACVARASPHPGSPDSLPGALP